MENLFFDDWNSILRTLFVTILSYLAMIFFLRASGKRTLSKMNAFDFIVTVALGSALANVALNKDVALADGALAFFLLIFLQYLITWLSVRVKKIKNIVTSQPVLLLYKGEVFNSIMKKERITIEELRVAVRGKGISDLSAVAAVILETTGEITVLPEFNPQGLNTVKQVGFFPEEIS
jgi:uncharacterized membrane protein YcaP (DUF421 family)